MYLIRILLLLVKSLVSLGEATSMSAGLILRLVSAHLKALFYLLRFCVTAIARVRLVPAGIIRLLVTSVEQVHRRFKRVLDKLTQFLGKLGKWIRATTLGVSLLHSRVQGLLRRLLSVIRRSFASLSHPFSRRHADVSALRRDQSLPVVSQDMQGRERARKVRIKYVRLTVLMIFLIFTCFVLAGYYAYTFYQSLPRPQDIGKTNFALSSHVYDRNGKPLYDFYKDQRRTAIHLSDLPPYVAQATIAIEDKDFYNHRGVSLTSGVIRALNETFIRKSGLQGGSTITQQLVKTALLSPERTFARKIKEIIIALETERMYTKDQILEMYLNQVPYGGSVYGIEEASRRFFGIPSKELSLSQAALLAGLPQAPTIYSPFTNREAAMQRRNRVLEEMQIQGYITPDEYETSVAEPVRILDDSIKIDAPHFVFYIRKYLERYLDTNELYQGGYMVHTTLDLEIQKEAEKILDEEIAKVRYLNVSNGAILITRPATGEILAMVGSVNYFDGESGEFNVTTGLRQPGSSIKPILYSYALGRGYTAATQLDDTPSIFQIPGSEVYRPVNYDGRFHGRVTLRHALANSFNIPAVRVINKVGVEDFINFATEAGIETWEDHTRYGLSLALGGGDVTMIGMAQAYGMLANQGERVDVTPVISVAGRKGVVVSIDDARRRRVVDPSNTYVISDILADNQARVSAFGTGSQLEIPGYKVAVKTGTTDEKRDNWTIGYTPDYLVVVWVGNNDHTPMNPYLTSGVTGAAPIWHRMMQYLLEVHGGGQKHWYEMPSGIVQKNCLGRQELFLSGTENTIPCTLPKKEPQTADNPVN